MGLNWYGNTGDNYLSDLRKSTVPKNCLLSLRQSAHQTTKSMADEDEVEEPKRGPATRLTTTPFDKKNYPATNQAHYCWQRFNEYVLCAKKNKGDETNCGLQWQMASSICPNDWVEAWQEQRQNGTFLGVQEREPKKSKGHH